MGIAADENSMEADAMEDIREASQDESGRKNRYSEAIDNRHSPAVLLSIVPS